MPDPFHRSLFEITVKFLDPCVVPYLVVTLNLYHGFLHLKMKENDLIVMYCLSSLQITRKRLSNLFFK